MDIRPPIAQIPIFALTEYQRSQILQRIIIPSLQAFPDEIIDSIQIETGKRSPVYTQSVNYKSLNNHPIEGKGTFIDIRI